MALPRILVLVLAGGAGGRLQLLTEQRAKPAVPFAGVYRLIDFPLSNCQHAQIADVWVSDAGRITDYAYKPDQPSTTTATNEVFVFSPRPTLDRIEALGSDAGEEGLEDLGTHLLPAQTRDGLARAYPMSGYWRDVGT